jgi:hypothetical protein
MESDQTRMGWTVCRGTDNVKGIVIADAVDALSCGMV